MTDRDRLIELHHEAGVEWDNYLFECLDNEKVPSETYDEFHADHLLANGVIVPPCKAGQTIYRVGKGKIWEWKIAVIEVYPNEIALVDDSDNYINQKDIGKTVFLTKEEAEEKLREREGK